MSDAADRWFAPIEKIHARVTRVFLCLLIPLRKNKLLIISIAWLFNSQNKYLEYLLN
ncbi:hypothetical protein SAMN03097723_3532 [Pantoea eucalypti]|nr:hypothetical protein SAMN03097723_3532 [Pantoea eucalypti]